MSISFNEHRVPFIKLVANLNALSCLISRQIIREVARVTDRFSVAKLRRKGPEVFQRKISKRDSNDRRTSGAGEEDRWDKAVVSESEEFVSISLWFNLSFQRGCFSFT